MKTLIIVQARMNSTRLPGKVFKMVLNKPLLEYQIERLRRVKLADKIVIATTISATDLPIAELCGQLGISCFRGSEEDVLDRYYCAASKFRADVIVRVTSDCPLIDPGVIDEIIAYYQDNSKKYDYVSNTLERTYPRGMDTEVFPFWLLEQAYQEAKTHPEREHVTPFIYQHPERYTLGSVKQEEDQSKYRWTVDTVEDFELIKNIIEAIYPINPYFSLSDILNLINLYPEWQKINEYVEQKHI